MFSGFAWRSCLRLLFKLTLQFLSSGIFPTTTPHPVY
jgi:hypothetical protein